MPIPSQFQAFDYYNFFHRYNWSETDFGNFQTLLANWASAGLWGIKGTACVMGLQVVPKAGMTVTVKAGIGISPNGNVCVLAADTDVALTSPIGNPAWSYIVLRTVQTGVNPITRPTVPFDTVNLKSEWKGSPVALNGTPAAGPAYPATLSDDIVVMGFKLTAGMATITTANYDVTQRNTVVRNLHRQITQWAQTQGATYTVAEGDDIIEVNAAGGAVSVALPALNLSVGRQLTVVKVDSSANGVTLTPNGTDGWLGATANPDLVNQGDKLTIYGNGVVWTP